MLLVFNLTEISNGSVVRVRWVGISGRTRSLLHYPRATGHGSALYILCQLVWHVGVFFYIRFLTPHGRITPTIN